MITVVACTSDLPSFPLLLYRRTSSEWARDDGQVCWEKDDGCGDPTKSSCGSWISWLGSRSRQAFGSPSVYIKIGTTGSATRCHCQACLMTHDFQRYSRSGRDRPLPLLSLWKLNNPLRFALSSYLDHLHSAANNHLVTLFNSSSASTFESAFCIR